MIILEKGAPKITKRSMEQGKRTPVRDNPGVGSKPNSWSREQAQFDTGARSKL